MPIREVHWEVTNRCDLHCLHCLPSSGQTRERELSTNEALSAVRSFAYAGASGLFLTGGEPLLRSDCLEIIRTAVSFGMTVSLITNGRRMTDELASALAVYGVSVGISFDGATSGMHDALRGVGSYVQALNAVHGCRQAGIPVRLYATIHHRNLHELQALGELARENQCSLHVSEITMGGRALENRNRLELTPDEHQRLPQLVTAMVRQVFGEVLSKTADDCWADGSDIFLNANGNAFQCSELAARDSTRPFADVRSDAFLETVRAFPAAVQGGCCYRVLVSPQVMFVGNSPESPCSMISVRDFNSAFDRTSVQLDELFRGIESLCENCSDPDCLGYVWLLPEEADRLYERDVPLVQVNHGPTFIHSFPETADGNPILSVRYPHCTLRCPTSGRCRIHRDRPFVCRLYPIGLETLPDGTVVWALHRDCAFVRQLEQSGNLRLFIERAREFIVHLPPQLVSSIMTTYKAVDSITMFPDGGNSFHVLGKAGLL